MRLPLLLTTILWCTGAVRAIASEPPSRMADRALPPSDVSISVPSIQSDRSLADLTIDLPPADVSPNHWAYTAVTALTTQYACLNGYPDGTFRGDEWLTRDEFAAALNACLTNALEQWDANRTADPDAIADVMHTLRELEAELGTLKETVETLETP